mmetsp:Transcript_58473/g.128198  ORF Transcript_58473/g.128198 Transcript_58473/m.128198 type:complete len:299 (+) Transcript_58473:117-1013(+)|eukprot:CAMPEP_0204262142 /NCGR_PEP_ID=MMETSP0468-20130131/7472_1 /ASSEMBLY_ACC=CAM_ASM_000383 /TAXON_ID=2969 /ORGANISM="Oxyrrhis marina" /LENGTH=298 /DNA_ID=CAMNT_0051236769 /DNA_START=34 /DNA_END=930 /DNA_ORIENTATION=+
MAQYGSMPENKLAAALHVAPRKKTNLVAVIANVFLPWMLFAFVFALISFSVHYDQPTWVWLGVAACYLLVFQIIWTAWNYASAGRGSTWWNYAAMASFVAVFVGMVVGDMNFWGNMQPFYDIEKLNTYPNVNPGIDRGGQRMDAGRIYFSVGTKLNTSLAMGFKNFDTFCVAPIVNVGVPEPSTYDFWAVGLNCCSVGAFRCPESRNPNVRAGLRLMRDDQRMFFRLAVQQAESEYGIRSAHPLFFYWLQDPVAEVNKYRDLGFRYYLLGIFSFFCFNSFAILVRVIAVPDYPQLELK